MEDVLPSIVGDPELTVESDEDLLAPEDDVEVEIKEHVDTDDVFDKPKKPGTVINNLTIITCKTILRSLSKR